MRIKSFRIENFRNLRLAACSDLPDFIVICGGNGCGKTALLEALMTAKEHAGSYAGFEFDTQAVAADGKGEWVNPLAPKDPHFTPKATNVIFLYMYGGPSHIDTFDHKPKMKKAKTPNQKNMSRQPTARRT